MIAVVWALVKLHTTVVYNAVSIFTGELDTMQQMSSDQPAEHDDSGGPLPTQAEVLEAARRQLALTLRRGELVWVVDERYDEPHTTWFIDAVRLGAQGRWVRQRHRYDGQARTLYFLGERALSDQEFRAARTSGTPFEVAAWQS